ncbi:MAG: hypothetical protein JSR26_03835 [Proteobacteria bacterium]|nr:hypothetical protein [Pseudomonadota bacterium]
MSLQSPSIVLSATSTTLHRNWAKAVSDALTALGVVKTADTGQVNLTGATLAYGPTPPVGNSSYSGYEMRKMSASGMPDIFLKIHYGTLSNRVAGAAYYYPFLRVQVGTGSDGAGNLTTFDVNNYIFTSCGVFYGGAAPDSCKPYASAQQCYLASDGANYLTIVLGTNAPVFESNDVCLMAFERTITPATGAYNARGVTAYNPSSSQADQTNTCVSYAYYDFTNAIVSNPTAWNSTLPAQALPWKARWQPGSNANLFPLTVCLPEPMAPPTTILGFYADDMVENTQIPVTLYGTSRTFTTCSRATVWCDPYQTAYCAIRIS